VAWADRDQVERQTDFHKIDISAQAPVAKPIFTSFTNLQRSPVKRNTGFPLFPLDFPDFSGVCRSAM
jgi:hypothetical protein